MSKGFPCREAECFDLLYQYLIVKNEILISGILRLIRTARKAGECHPINEKLNAICRRLMVVYYAVSSSLSAPFGFYRL
jgi:hypothetical protein